MRIVFMGTPDFAVPTLAALRAADGIEVTAVYSQPPRRAGRGKQLRPTPIHAAALAHDIPVHTPADLKSAEAQAEFRALGADAAAVVAYGLILPAAILQAPRLGCFNLHGSLLPRWRGAAPIQRALMAGDPVTGICIMAMDEGLDTGAVLLRAELPIAAEATAGELSAQLAEMGAPMMVEALRGAASGQLQVHPQPEVGVTYAKKIDKAEACIDWSRPAVELDRLIRGLSPFPGAWCERQSVRIKVLLARPEMGEAGAPPGTVLDDNLLIACGEGALRLSRLQRSGRAVMAAADFLRGNPLQPGDQLD
ncbi:MAG: methionyl-tRNA formyltransferase [Proteobacteria bacterium]|nr:methionyl-tRNA formyltransferase [Pseudomonadota bacterium]